MTRNLAIFSIANSTVKFVLGFDSLVSLIYLLISSIFYSVSIRIRKFPVVQKIKGCTLERSSGTYCIFVYLFAFSVYIDFIKFIYIILQDLLTPQARGSMDTIGQVHLHLVS